MGTSLRLLLVDDEPHVLGAYKRALRSLRREWMVCTAEGSRDAMKQLEHRGFDVVLTDVAMIGLDGIDLLTWVRSTFPRTHRMVVSGMIDGNTLVAVSKVAQAHLIKPVTIEKVVAGIEQLLVDHQVSEARAHG
jgi:DNA-binding NtrC family response regulator